VSHCCFLSRFHCLDFLVHEMHPTPARLMFLSSLLI
jgi:hypothetical protein